MVVFDPLWQWVLLHNFTFRRSTGSLHIANQDGRTPRMVAASKGRRDIAKQLLAAGAFINLQVFFLKQFTQNQVWPLQG